jgi:hypothetical protein
MTNRAGSSLLHARLLFTRIPGSSFLRKTKLLMNRNILIMLEVVWLLIALLSLLAGIYNLIGADPGESTMFFIIALIAFMMYFYRKHLRGKNQR